MPSLHQARLRHALHYLDFLRKAEASFARGQESFQAVKILIENLSNIEAAIHWGEENSSDPEVAEICSAFPKAGALLFSHIYPARMRLRMAEQARAAAALSGDRQAECWHVGNLGVARMQLNQPEAAYACFEDALNISYEIGDKRSESRCIGNLGLLKSRRGDYTAAVALFEQALSLSSALGDWRHTAQVLGYLTAVYEALGDHECALSSAHVSLTIARQLDYPASETAALNNLSLILGDYGQWEEATDEVCASLKIARRLHDRHTEAIALNSMGIIFLNSSHEIHRAEDCFELALCVNREMEDSEGVAYALLNLSIVAERSGDTERARSLRGDALALAEQIAVRLNA
jgi:tetratricopeptide (TPR) repeat protein